jgi:hypothetical protein
MPPQVSLPNSAQLFEGLQMRITCIITLHLWSKAKYVLKKELGE